MAGPSRSTTRRPSMPTSWSSVSACDPLNLIGVVTPGPRVAAVLGHRVTYRDGVPVDEARGRAERVGERKRR